MKGATYVVGFVAFLYLCCVAQSQLTRPTFGSYDCSTGQWTINFNAAAGTNAQYGVYYLSNNARLFTFTTGGLGVTSGSYYITPYTGLNFSIGSAGSGNFAIYDTASAPTCSQTYPLAIDEITRVIAAVRISLSQNILYRNLVLDRAAQQWGNTSQFPTIPADVYNSDSVQSGQVVGTYGNPNPGGIVQSLVNSNATFLSERAKEIGVASNGDRIYLIVNGRPSKCGNGVLDFATTEKCDDGNTNDSDGCSISCQIEDGYTCNQNIINETSVCTYNGGTPPSTSSSPTSYPSNTRTSSPSFSASNNASRGAITGRPSTASNTQGGVVGASSVIPASNAASYTPVYNSQGSLVPSQSNSPPPSPVYNSAGSVLPAQSNSNAAQSNSNAASYTPVYNSEGSLLPSQSNSPPPSPVYNSEGSLLPTQSNSPPPSPVYNSEGSLIPAQSTDPNTSPGSVNTGSAYKMSSWISQIIF